MKRPRFLAAEPQLKPERTQPTTRAAERGFLDRLHTSTLNPFAKERATALLGLFMFTTAGCERADHETPQQPEVATEAKPPLPEELAKDVKYFQDRILQIDSYHNPINIHGVAAEINVSGNISLNELDNIVVDMQEVGESLSEQGIQLLDQDTDPLSYLSNTTDHPQPTDKSGYTVPGYQLSATYSHGEQALQLRNWINSTMVLEAQVPHELIQSADIEELMLLPGCWSLGYELAHLESASPAFQRMESYVVYSLDTAIDQLKASKPLEPATALKTMPNNAFLTALASVQAKFPNTHIKFEGYTSSIALEGASTLEKVNQLNTSIHAVEAVLAQKTGSKNLYPESSSPTQAIEQLVAKPLTEAATPTEAAASLSVPRHHIQYTLDDITMSLRITITDNVTNTTIAYIDTYGDIGEVKSTEEERAAQDLAMQAEDAQAIEAMELADDAIEQEIDAEQASLEKHRAEIKANFDTFSTTLTKAVRDDKVGMYSAYEALRATQPHMRFEKDITLLRVVEGSGIERLRYLVDEKDFSIYYTMLPATGFEDKEADTKYDYESGYQMGEYGGTLFVEGHLTNLSLKRTVFHHNEEYTQMKVGVRMEKDKYGNLIFREVTYDPENDWYSESLNIMLRLPATEDDTATMADVSVDLSAYNLGDYPELLKHVPDHPELTLNDQNADYQVYSRVKELDVEDYDDELEQIGAGAAQAERLFGFEPGELMRNIIIIDTNDVNAHYAYDKPTTIVINDEYLKNQPLPDQWNVGFHETVHLIANKYQLDKIPELVEWYERLQRRQSSLLRDVNEKNWFEDITIGGHAQDNLAELLPSLIRSTLDENLEVALQKLTASSRQDYIQTCETLATALEAVYENYDTATAKPTVHLKLRAAAEMAKKITP